MNVDSDMQVWLDTVERARAGMVIPYVVSDQPRQLRYRVKAVQEGGGGRSVIGQAGEVQLSADVPVALSRLSVSRRPGDHCEIEVILTERGKQERRYLFECPS